MSKFFCVIDNDGKFEAIDEDEFISRFADDFPTPSGVNKGDRIRQFRFCVEHDSRLDEGDEACLFDEDEAPCNIVERFEVSWFSNGHWSKGGDFDTLEEAQSEVRERLLENAYERTDGPACSDVKEFLGAKGLLDDSKFLGDFVIIDRELSGEFRQRVETLVAEKYATPFESMKDLGGGFLMRDAFNRLQREISA